MEVVERGLVSWVYLSLLLLLDVEWVSYGVKSNRQVMMTL